MYLPIQPQKTCARAWVAAALQIKQQKEAYNVVIDVEHPSTHEKQDHAAITLVDKFLRKRCQNPISTVANTIFPQAMFDAHGSPDFYQEYWNMYDSLTTGWGRYFERLTRHQKLDGKVYNPLQTLIDRLRDRKKPKAQPYKSAYELAVYDPLLDGRTFRGGQCLSFISLKLDPERGLLMTALYRNHTYITRCLGNLIGLGRLQAFIANEAQVPLGSLTCVSTHAELDTGPGWGIVDARRLVDEAAELLEFNADQVTG